MSLLRFIKFILTETFPACDLCRWIYYPPTRRMGSSATTGSANHVPTLNAWAMRCQAHKDGKRSPSRARETYDKFPRTALFRATYTDVRQFTLVK